MLRELVERLPSPAPDNGTQVRSALRDIETVLLRHLAFEDARLYPVLEAAEPAIAERARRYRIEMGDLSGRVVGFFERWIPEGAIETEPLAFAQAWDEVRTALERRMSAEDDDLYQMAEERIL